jgi:predicted RNA-binding protein with PUA-like domain
MTTRKRSQSSAEPTDSKPTKRRPRRKGKDEIDIAEVTRTTPETTAAANGTAQESNPDDRPQYFLLKSEPHKFSITDLQQSPNQTSEWDGVRNYGARNHLRSMKVNDMCWFYHSSCKTPAIVGCVRVTRVAVPDSTAYADPHHENYDPKSTPESCPWVSTQVQLEEVYEDAPITLQQLRDEAKTNLVVANMMLLKRGRLSVMPVTEDEWNAVNSLRLGKTEPQPSKSPETKRATKKKAA